MPSGTWIAAFGEVMLRLSAPGAESLLRSGRLETFFGGAEANTAAGVAALGGRVRIITALPGNPLGDACIGELRRRGLDTTSVLRREGRLGLYFHTPGAMRRPADIVYDRAGSVFATTPAAEWDWNAALAGATWLHLSGITPALGEEAATSTLAAAKTARANGLTVSFDFNYREKLWAARAPGADSVLKAIAAEATLLFASARDLARIADFDMPPDPRSALKAGAAAAFAACPALSQIATTFRTTTETGRQSLSAILTTRDARFESGPEVLSGIVERIGGGDAFAAGLIHMLSTGAAGQEALDTALTVMAVKHSMPGDMCAVTADDVLRWREGGDLRR